MKVKLVRIGNSRGIRLPREILATYGLREGAELELEERREGVLIRVRGVSQAKIPWEAAYREMAADATERAEWDEWDAVSGDGRDG